MINRTLLRRSASLGLMGGWLALTCGVSLANVIVFDSSVPGIQIGQDLTDDRQLNVPFGTHLLVIAGQDSKLKQVQINGPRTGTVSELLNPQPLPARLLSLLIRTAQSGGSDQSDTAAARGRSTTLLLNQIAVEPNAAICVEEGALPTIELAPGGNNTVINVTDHQGSRSAPLNLTSGAGAPWPTNVPIRDSGVYRIIAISSPQIEFKLRLVPRGALGDVTTVQSLDALEARGCRHQVSAALGKITGRQ